MPIPDPDQQNPIIGYPIACYLVGVYLILCIFISVSIIFAVYCDFISILLNDSQMKIYVLCGAFGMLGAAVASSRKYYRYLITYSTSINSRRAVPPADWSWGWIYYYLTRPILGAILGALAYLLSFIGFHILAEDPTLPISKKGRYLLLALAFMSGFSVSDVLDRLSAVSKQLFDTKSNIITKGD